jgi:predicted dehydrogenase
VISDPEVEAIYNPLANGLHAEWNLLAIAAGKHVLSEKPFAADAPEAREVHDAGKRAGVAVVDGFHYPPRDKTASRIAELRRARRAAAGRNDDDDPPASPGGPALVNRYQLEAFTALVRHGVPMPTDSDDAVHTMELIDECYRAIGLDPRPRHRPATSEGA